MTKFDEVTEAFEKVKYMDAKQAACLRTLICQNHVHDILEIGFFRGKSSAYIAAVLEDRGGAGMLTTIDRRSAATHRPNIHDLLQEAGLSHRVTTHFAFRSFTWELLTLIQRPVRPRFDFCYFDGGHTWDDTGFGFTLVNLLLRPGGIVVFDDINWSIKTSSFYQNRPDLLENYSEDEAKAKTVRLVRDTLAPEFGYAQIEEIKQFGWSVVQKPAALAAAPHSRVYASARAPA